MQLSHGPTGRFRDDRQQPVSLLVDASATVSSILDSDMFEAAPSQDGGDDESTLLRAFKNPGHAAQRRIGRRR